VIDVAMAEDATLLDEVVVIGYGTVRRRDLTGAVSSVKSEELTMTPTSNAIEAMQGRVAGLDIQRSSGRAGSGSSIQLRGNRTLERNTEDPQYRASNPLYIIDGIAGSIDNLNPNDIATIDVLKDASSTAIYGSQGANGVIVVTTKKADKGKVQIDFDAYVGINAGGRYPHALQGDAWFDYLYEGYRATYPNAAKPTKERLLMDYGYSADALMPYVNKNQWIDWVDETLRTGVQQNYTVSIRGGNDKTQANFSLGYYNNQGIYDNDVARQYTMRAGVNTQVKDWVSAGITVGLNFQDNNTRGSRVNKTFGMVPLGQVYNEDGSIREKPIDGLESVISPIVDDISGTYENNTKAINLTVNPYIDFNIAKGLTLRSILGTSLSTSRGGIFNSDHTYMVLTGSSAAVRNATYGTKLNYGYTWENILTYNTVIARDHELTATLVSSWANSQHEESSAYSEGFLYDDYLWYALSTGTKMTNSSKYNGTKMMSFAGRLNYAYKGRYLFTASVRTDGASQLYNHWDTFPAAALAWRISDEDFMQNLHWLANLKLRVGYGVSGNSNIAAYSSLTEVTSSGLDPMNLGGGLITAAVPTSAVGNQQLGWERSYNANVGLDIGLWKNRVEATVEYYDTDTKDILYGRKLPYSGGGFTAKTAYTMTANLARMRNRGVEVTLITRNIENKNFRWNSTLTFASNKEEVRSIDLGSGTTLDDLISLGLFMGHPSRTTFGIKKLGIWQLGEEADAAVFGLLPGDTKVQSNLTKVRDGVWVDNTDPSKPVEYTADKPYTVSSKDRIIYGQGVPKWTAGFNNSFYYKNFDLTIFAMARWGYYMNAGVLGFWKSIAQPDNYSYWTPENPTNDFPRPYLQRTVQYSSPSESLTVVDGSYIKVKNITLGYTLPDKIGRSIGLGRARVYGTLYNPFIYTKSHLLKGADPETGAGDEFPLYRQMVFGVNLSF
jgi:TonB-linked SusC/RagA family outer membrane protein